MLTLKQHCLNGAERKLRYMCAPEDEKAFCRQARDIYRENRERISKVFYPAKAAIAITGPDGRFQQSNPAYCSLLGYTEEELRKLSYASLLHPDDRAANLTELERLHAGQLPLVRVSGRYRHKNGQFIHIQKCISMVSDQGDVSAHLITVTGSGKFEEKRNHSHDHELLERLYETIPVLLVMWDPQLERFTLNAQTEKVLGWTTEDANDGDFMCKVYPDPEYRARVSMYMQTLEPGWREWLVTAKSGEKIPIEWANIRLSDRTLIGIGVDLRQRKEAEAALMTSEARFRGLVESNVIGVTLADVNTGRVLEANDEYLRIIGRTRRELQEGLINWKAITPPEHLKREEMLVCCCQAGESTLPFDKTYLRPDGTEAPVYIGGSVLAHDPDKAVAFVLDIGERKEAEQALRASEKRYRLLFRTMAEGFALHQIICDTEGKPCDYRFLEVNPAFERLTGLRACDVIGKTVLEVQPDIEPFWIEMYGRVALSGTPEHFENYSAVFGRDYDVYAYSPSPGQFAVVFMDITERKKAERALKRLNESLEELVSERTEEVRQQAAKLRALASQLSQTEQRERKRLAKILHDHIQQLIVAARMQMAWMKCDGDSERQAIVQGIDSILEEALHASRSLAIDLSPPVLHEAGLIGGLNWMATQMWAKHQFTVSLQADNKAEPATEEIRFLLFECARELVFNAIKHAQVSEVNVALKRTDSGELELTVSDNGAGFDAELLNKRRPDEVTFGLFSIRERLAHMGGQMSVDTVLGQGTRIRLTVPGGAPEPSPSEEQSAASREILQTCCRSNTCRVLIVDDHKIMREGLFKLLQYEAGFEVVGQAADGQQAVQLAEQLKPDVIIMDINMGEMSGIEATRRIVANNPETKVIGLSMHDDRNVVKAMRDAGAAAYLTKMGPSDDLIAAVRACVSVQR